LATTFTAYQPQALLSPDNRGYDIQAFPISAGSTYVTGAVLDLATSGASAGSVFAVADSPSTLIGIALHDATAVFGATGTVTYANSSLFGVGANLGTPLFPGDQAYQLVAMAHNGAYFEFSLETAISATTTIGLPIGISLVSGVYGVSNTDTDIGHVVAIAGVPVSIAGTIGQNAYAVGDIQARVVVQFDQSACTI